jgi:CBS domain-containing protein
MAQKIRDVMSTNLVTLDMDQTVIGASKAMRDNNVGDVIVVEGDQLLGILTDRDIVVRGLAEGKSPNDPASAIATTELTTLSPDDDAVEAVERMRREAIRRVPVVEDGRPVGIVSLGDLAQSRDPASALSDISSAPPQS